MRSLLINHSYLGVGDLFAPWRRLDQLLHPYRHVHNTPYLGRDFQVRWTERAERALQAGTSPLLVEMQLYFSCMVKKRVLFHQAAEPSADDAITINPSLKVVLRSVEAQWCDPEEFARNYPARRTFDNPAIKKVAPRRLDIDYRQGQWQGEFQL